jgi:hypothetical protein
VSIAVTSGKSGKKNQQIYQNFVPIVVGIYTVQNGSMIYQIQLSI